MENTREKFGLGLVPIKNEGYIPFITKNGRKIATTNEGDPLNVFELNKLIFELLDKGVCQCKNLSRN